MDAFTVAPSQLEELITRLTPRQLQIVELLVCGHTKKRIANILSISPETVKTHIHKVCTKLEVDNRIQVVVIYTVWKVRNETIAANNIHPK
jgi:DNA-binding NarL/FixJ family response regulator